VENLVKEIEQADIILHNVNHARIKALMDAYGYNASRFQQGTDLLNQLLLLQQSKKEEYQTKHQIGRGLRANEEQMHRLFKDHRTLAKWVFRRDVDEYQRLGLHQPIAQHKAVKTEQIVSFYREALKTPEQLVHHGISQAELEQGQAMISSIIEARRQRLEKKGEAEEVTQKRNQVRRDLRTWVADFRTVARIALRQEPQLMEALGMVVLS